MTDKRKGFALVEVIVVLVILAILAAVMIPSMTGWIDKAKEKRLIVACRTCVTAAQTLVSEAYGVSGTAKSPEASAVVALAGVKGNANSIYLDPATAKVIELAYIEGTDSVTYLGLPSPHYVFGVEMAEQTSAAWNWAQNYKRNGKQTAEYLTLDYGGTTGNPTLHTPLSNAQIESIFGDLELQFPNDPYYIYPLAIYGTDGKPLNVQYVTNLNPVTSGGHGRYSVAALIIDGETYITAKRLKENKNAIQAQAEVGPVAADRFQNIMNSTTRYSTQDFIAKITENNYFTKVQ